MVFLGTPKLRLNSNRGLRVKVPNRYLCTHAFITRDTVVRLLAMARLESIRIFDQCCRTLDKEQDWVGLEPCAHVLCPRCFIDCLCARGRFNSLKCPVTHCCKAVENHTYHAWDTDQNAWVQSITPHNLRSRSPALKSDPFRYFHCLGSDKRRGKMVVFRLPKKLIRIRI